RSGERSLCLYRQPVEDLIRDNNEHVLLNNWKKIIPADESGNFETAVSASRGAANRIIPVSHGNEEARKRTACCYALHMFKNDSMAYVKNRFEHIYSEITK